MNRIAPRSITARPARLAFASFGVAALVLGACGGDDDDASLTDDQQFVVDDTMAAMEEFGVGLDEGCVNGLATQIPDADAQLYRESEGEADGFSAEFEALGEQMQTCVTNVDGLIDQLVTDFEGFFDGDCLREAYGSIEPAEVLDSLSDPDVLDTSACEL